MGIFNSVVHDEHKCGHSLLKHRIELLERALTAQDKRIEKVLTELFALNNPPKFKKGQKVVWQKHYPTLTNAHDDVIERGCTEDKEGVIMKFIGNDQYANKYLVETGAEPKGYKEVSETVLKLKK